MKPKRLTFGRSGREESVDLPLDQALEKQWHSEIWFSERWVSALNSANQLVTSEMQPLPRSLKC